VQCTVCNKISISFDPFNMLSVPLPINKELKLTVKYFPWNLGDRPKEFIMNVGEFVTFSEIKSKL
jgi:ubiquitin carboxyl-terminal hydrolase 4/11/15